MTSPLPGSPPRTPLRAQRCRGVLQEPCPCTATCSLWGRLLFFLSTGCQGSRGCLLWFWGSAAWWRRGEGSQTFLLLHHPRHWSPLALQMPQLEAAWYNQRKSGSSVLYPSLPARQWLVTKLVRTPAASTAFHDHVEVVTEVLASWSGFLSAVSLTLSFPQYARFLLFWGHPFL